MNIVTISGATRALGAPTDWDATLHGACGALPIRDEDQGGLPAMVSAWLPTPEELQRLNQGAAIHLEVMGTAHPPVMLSVEQLNIANKCTRPPKGWECTLEGGHAVPCAALPTFADEPLL